MKAWYDTTAVVLAAIGAINWGLAVFNFNLVNAVLGSIPALETTVYGLVGLAGLWTLYVAFK